MNSEQIQNLNFNKKLHQRQIVVLECSQSEDVNKEKGDIYNKT